MNEIIKLFNIYPSNGQAGWILSVDGICSTIVSVDGGMGKEPKILVVKDE